MLDLVAKNDLFYGDLLRSCLANTDKLGTPAEVRMLLGVMNQSTRFNDIEVPYSVNEMVNGKYASDGNRKQSPICTSTTTADRVIATLGKKGLLSSRHTQGGMGMRRVDVDNILERIGGISLTATDSVIVDGMPYYYGSHAILLVENMDMFGSFYAADLNLFFGQMLHAYGKTSDTISMAQIKKGQTRKSNGIRMQCGLDMPYKQQWKAAQILEDCEAIGRSYWRNRNLTITQNIPRQVQIVSKLKVAKRRNSPELLCEIGEAPTQTSRLKAPNRTKNDQIVQKMTNLTSPISTHRTSPISTQLPCLLKTLSAKDVISKDITSDSDKIDSRAKPDQECNSCTDLPIPSTSVLGAAQAADPKSFPTVTLDAAPAADENVLSTCSEEESPMEGNSSPIGSVEEAVASVKKRSAAATKKSAKSIATRLTKTNVIANWKECLPLHGYRGGAETLDRASWGAIHQIYKHQMLDSDKSAIPAVMDWAIKNWPILIYASLQWTKDYDTLSVTRTPSLPAFCRYYDRISKLFDETLLDAPESYSRKQANAVVADAVNNANNVIELKSAIHKLEKENGDLRFAEVCRDRQSRSVSTASTSTPGAAEAPLSDEEFAKLLDLPIPEWGGGSDESVELSEDERKEYHRKGELRKKLNKARKGESMRMAKGESNKRKGVPMYKRKSRDEQRAEWFNTPHNPAEKALHDAKRRNGVSA